MDHVQNDVKGKEKDEFIGQDGLLHCSKCGSKRELVIRIKAFGYPVEKKVRCLCKCQCEEREREEAERERREAERRLKLIRNTSLMDNRFFNARFSSAVFNKYNQKNMKLCQEYASGFPKMQEKNQGLLFWGDVGTGKSYAAACIANELMDKGIPVVMTSFVKLLSAVRNQDQEEKIISLLSTAKLVVFDDLGAERSTDYAIEKVYNIVDSRYRSNLPMIVTTNMTFPEMLNESDLRYSRIYDRIFEVCYPVQWTGYSWRKFKAKNRFDQMRKTLEG